MQFVADLERERRRRDADHVRDRRATRPDGVDARPPERVRRARARCGSATAPTTSARTTSSGPCSTRSCCTPAAASACRAACGRSCRRRRRAPRRCGASRTRASGRRRGKPQHYVSSKLMCWVALDRAAKLADDARRRRPQRERGRPPPRRSTPTCSSTGVTSDGRAAAALRHRRPRRLDAPGPALRASSRARTSGPTPACMAIADDLTENGYVLRYRTDETDDGLSGKEGTFLICSYWLVSALSHRGRAAAGTRPVRAAAAHRLTARPVRRGVRRRHRLPPRQLPAGVLAPRTHRGRRPDHPGRVATPSL